MILDEIYKSNIFSFMSVLEKLQDKGLKLPPAPKAAGLYKTVWLEGRSLMFSGHLPILEDGTILTGKVGSEISIEDGSFAAQQVGLNILASLQMHLGDLSKIDRVVKLLGMINAEPTFEMHPQVLNGCSKLFYDLWGEDRGVGVRSAFGVSGLPFGASVEIEGSFLLKE